MKKDIDWCLKLKDGLKITEPNENLAKAYLLEAKYSIERAEKNFKDGDLLWTTVVIYYAEYYALYAFLQKIGLKCENHFCSILAVAKIFGEEKIKIINEHKNKRIDAQYYMRISKEAEVKQMLADAKIFISNFHELISNITENETIQFRSRIK